MEAMIRPLTVDDLPGALALSAAAHWNQVEADWRVMLAMGQGWGLHAPDAGGHPRLVASALILPYGEDFAWTSMVLVAAAFRRRGYATRLLRLALGTIAQSGRTAMLDATPAGRPVYQPLGFRDTSGFTRYRRRAGTTAPPPRSVLRTRPLRADDWSAIEAVDAVAFGADRLELLRHLAGRQPLAARVATGGRGMRGVVFGRDGRDASQIGPLLAEDASTAIALLDDALATLPGTVCIDLLDDRASALQAWLSGNGFEAERPFTRMAHGTSTAPGSTAKLWLVAGPELG